MNEYISASYLIQHKLSASEAQIELSFDEQNNPCLTSIKMLSGKVIPLTGIKNALKYFQEEYGTNKTSPDQLA